MNEQNMLRKILTKIVMGDLFTKDEKLLLENLVTRRIRTLENADYIKMYLQSQVKEEVS